MTNTNETAADLTAELNLWYESNDLEPQSADEALYQEGLTADQVEYLLGFTDRWERATGGRGPAPDREALTDKEVQSLITEAYERASGAKCFGPQPLPYSIKKLKQWEGMDGVGCHGEVHGPDGIVATFRDEGNGGGLWPEAPYDQKAQTYDRAALKAFKEWANAHPILDITWKAWGFTPASNDHTDQVIEWLLVENAIAKEVKKGYLCFQLEDPYESRGAKQGRKKMKYTSESAAWLKKQLPGCVIRNEETPSWCLDEVQA